MASPRISVPGLTKKFNSALTILILSVCIGPSSVSTSTTFSRCPASCLCVEFLFRGTFAYCSERSLTDVPQSFQGDFAMISLAYNRIDGIRQHDFSNPLKVETLDLKYNVITNIHEKAFANLKELRTLDLSYNRINVIPSSLFENNSKLENLYLRSNMLSIMGPIVHSVSLKNLDISSCIIYYLPYNAFMGVPNLNTLNLNDNPLINLATDTFQNVIQHFKNKSVKYFPTIICELDCNCYINNKFDTVTEMHLEIKQDEHKIYHNYVEHSLFIIFVCVFICGIFCILFINKCLIRRKVAPNSNVSNPETLNPTFSSADSEVMPWYKRLLLGISRKGNTDVGTARKSNH